MAERKIIRSVHTGKRILIPGMEDELAKELSQDELDRLKSKGYLDGNWTSTQGEPVKTSAKESTTKEPAKESAAKEK